MHFLVQLCEQPGHILGAYAAPRPGWWGVHPTRVWRIIQGRTKADARSQPLFVPRARRVSSGRKFDRATILGREGGGDLWPAYLIEIDGTKMRGWYG